MGEIVNEPLTGGYGCVDVPGFMGGAIRLLTRSQYSHAFVVLDAKQGIILEAEPKGSRISDLNEYRNRHLNMIFSKDVVQATPQEIMAYGKTLQGIPYNFTDILYLGLELGPGWRPAWLLDQVLDDTSQICSQLVAFFGAHFQKDGEFRKYPWNCGQDDAQLVTPGMLAARIS